MPALELLDSGVHATVRAARPCANASPFVRITYSEIIEAAVICPVLLSKHAQTGAFYAGALFGFREGEMLVAQPDGKLAFTPAELIREGFFADGESIALDPSHARFHTTQGESLFDAQGHPTVTLQSVQKALGRLIASAEASDAFIAALLAHGLIEPIDITLNFDDGERLQLEGLYTVSLDALDDMTDAAALALVRSGHLRCAYAMVASLHHVKLMARRRNAQLTAG